MKPQDMIDTQFLPFLQQLADDCMRDASLLKFDKKHPHQLYPVCIYGTIVEISFGCLALVEKRQLTALPTLLRSLLEAYADFQSCLKDPDYFNSMYASFLKEKLRLLKKVIATPESPYLKGIVQSVDMLAEKATLNDEIEKLKQKGYGTLGVWDRFSKADMEYEYQSVYWSLCLHAHNNISALEDRHIEKEGDDYNVVFFKEDDPKDLIRYFDTLCAVMINSSLRIHELLSTKTANRYEGHLKQLNCIRKHYTL